MKQISNEEMERFNTLYNLLDAITEISEDIRSIDPVPDDLVRISNLMRYAVRKHLGAIGDEKLHVEKG